MADFSNIESERLYMRPFKDEDAIAMLEYHSDPDVVRFIPWNVRTISDVEEVVAKSKTAFQLVNEGDYLTVALCRKSDHQLVGQMNAMYRSKEDQRGEIGYVLNPKHRGHGYASEAATALVSALFGSGLFHRIIAHIDPRNASSWQLAERIGLRREAHHLHASFFKGEWTDAFIYATLQDEWQARHPQ